MTKKLEKQLRADAPNMPHSETEHLLNKAASTLASYRKRLAKVEKERDEARAKLFPYADATEIVGYSTRRE